MTHCSSHYRINSMSSSEGSTGGLCHQKDNEDDDSEDRVLSLNCFDACFTVLTKVAN